MGALDEVQEHSHEASSGFDKRVAATIAVIAASLAIVSVLGHLASTEELLNQQRASDQWAFYQAKAIRLHIGEVFLEIAIVFASLAILTKRSLLWMTGIGSAPIGLGVAATQLLVK